MRSSAQFRETIPDRSACVALRSAVPRTLRKDTCAREALLEHLYAALAEHLKPQERSAYETKLANNKMSADRRFGLFIGNLSTHQAELGRPLITRSCARRYLLKCNTRYCNSPIVQQTATTRPLIRTKRTWNRLSGRPPRRCTSINRKRVPSANVTDIRSTIVKNQKSTEVLIGGCIIARQPSLVATVLVVIRAAEKPTPGASRLILPVLSCQ